MGLLTLADAKAVERYAEIYSRWRDAEGTIREFGQVMRVLKDDGSVVPKKNPAVAIASDLIAHLARLEGQFGLTPAARAGLTATLEPGLPLGETSKSHFFESPFVNRGR